MPRDLMHRGPRPPGPRAAQEFEEMWLCDELDAEDKAAGETEKAEPGELPPFEFPSPNEET